MPIDAQRIQAVFLAATEIEGPPERARFLDGACDGDAELRSRVEALLRAHDQRDTLLDRATVAPREHDGATATTVAFEGGEAADDGVPLGFLAPATRPDSLGRIGHYEVLQVLGQGGFGIVFRAFDDVLHRVVAVKVLSPQLAATSPARKRFLREARSSAQVRHENVVQVYEVGEQPLPYIAMEFIPGETLQQRLDRTGPIDVVEVVRIGRQVAEGLVAAHAMDLIHRDIKPGNILLEGGQLRVKITDFGLARAADDASLSQSGIIAGTPMYMAPEQAKGEAIDQRADLFSLGSVLYVMAAGRPPFRANSTVAVLKRVAEDAPRPIREIIPETPQWLCDIIAKLHAKDPADRFQSAREVADVLADCEAQLKANSRLKDFSRIPRRKSQRSGRRKWVAAAAVLLLPVLALGVAEFAGLTHPYRGQRVTHDSNKAGVEPTPIQVAMHEPPPLAVAPFDAARAKQHQEAWATHLGVPVEYTNSIGMRFALIPPGEFMMGSTRDEIEAAEREIGQIPDIEERTTWLGYLHSEAPQHKVILTQPIYMGVTEVTQGDYEYVMGRNPSYFGPMGAGKEAVAGLDTSDHPAEMVSWDQAAEFCDRLSEREKLKRFDLRARVNSRPLDRTGYRLPSEAQWEFACRAGTATTYWGGDEVEDLARAGWFGGNSGDRTHAAGELKANPFGLSDVLGNVWEWVQDPWDQTDFGRFRKKPATNPIGPFSTSLPHVIRGGHWGDHLASFCRSSSRHAGSSDHYKFIGFRASLPVDAVKAAMQQTPVPVANRAPLPPTFKNGIGMEFVIVPKGKSWLGGGKDRLGDKEVVIPADFYLGKYEVTQEEWEKVMGENPSRFSRTGEGKAEVKDITDADLKRFSVENVSWDQCQLFVAKLNKLGKEPGWVYRLPTEAEWEYACRGGPMADKTPSAFDFYLATPTNTLLREQASFRHDNSSQRTCKVGNYQPNRLGLYEMHGNVCEWCLDEIFGEAKDGQQAASRRVFRGGSWEDGLDGCVAKHRFSPVLPSEKGHGLGLRLARVPSGDPTPEARTPLAVAPFTDADVKRIAVLPAAEQVEEVRKELIRRNPGFDGKVGHKIEDGVVTEFRIVTDHVTDISPIRVWSALRVLDCCGTYNDGKAKTLLVDLEPLAGINPATLRYLNLNNTRVGDAGLAIFKDCKNLVGLQLYNTNLSDRGLANFKGCKDLTYLLTIRRPTSCRIALVFDTFWR